MNPDTLRARSRVALAVVGLIAGAGAWSTVGDVAVKGQGPWLEDFLRAVAFTLVVVVLVGLIELARGVAERRSDGVAGPVAVVAAGIALIAVVTGLAASRWPVEPTPVVLSAAEGRAVLEGVLDAMIAAAGNNGHQIGEAVAGLQRQAGEECRHGDGKYGESLRWHYEARTTAAAASWTVGTNEVVDFSAGAKAAADRVARAMEVRGFKARAWSGDALITIDGSHRDGSFVLVQMDVYETNALRDVDRARWRRMLDSGTVPLHLQVDATSQCLTRA